METSSSDAPTIDDLGDANSELDHDNLGRSQQDDSPALREQNSSNDRFQVIDAGPTSGQVRASANSTAEPVAVEQKAVEQIAERIRVDQQTVNNRKETTIEIELDPPELGRARVELTESENGIAAKIVMSREASARVVEQNLDALRESLRDSGVDVSEFDITYEDPSEDRRQDFDDEIDRTPFPNFPSESSVRMNSPIPQNPSSSNRRIDLSV